MFVYSAISCEEILSFPIFLACVRTCRYLLRRAATPTVKRSATFPLSRLVTKRHDCASGPSKPAREPSEGRAEPGAQRTRVDEVRERPLAVDLDDGQELAIRRFEVDVAVDVDELEVEADLRLRLAD